jgi:hypothetical protein
MPAIILLSSQNDLRSPFNHGGDHLSIGLRSSAITLHVSPHTPGGSQAPLSALGGRALPRPGRQEGKRRADRPRHRLERGNARNLEELGVDRYRSAAIWRNWPVSQTHPLRVTVTGVTIDCSNLLPGASHRHNRVMRRLELLRFPSIARCYEVTGTRRKGFSRVACHIPGSSLVGTARSRPSRSGRNARNAAFPWIARPSRPGRGAGGPLPGARSEFDLLRLVRAASENFGGPSQKTFVQQ